MSNYYVYAYFDPDTEEIFYIGKGKDDRCYVHLNPINLKNNTMFYCKLRKILKEGKFPKIRKLVENVKEETAFFIEKGLIQEYGRRDLGTGCLCNQTDGGDGLSGYKFTPEQCERNRLKQLGKKASLDTRIKMSQPKSKKGRENIKRGCINYRGRPIESYDLKTGKIIKKYPYIAKVKEDGYHASGVSNVLNGHKNNHKGLGWRDQT